MMSQAAETSPAALPQSPASPLAGGGWKSPELPACLFCALLLALLLLPQSPMLRDLDIGWLVRTGEHLWQTQRLPREDIFSFTQAGRPWVLYQWGSELFFGGLHHLAALGGVIWGTALAIALTYSILLYYLLRLGVNRLLSLGIVFLVILTNVFYWYTRPATLTFLLYTVILLVLEDYRQTPGKQIWALPLLFILWTNLHLGFIVALGAVGLYALAIFFLPGASRGAGAPRDARLLLLVPLCFLAVCFNPYGIRLLADIFVHSTSGFVTRSQLSEMQSPDFHSLLYIFLFAFLVLLIWTRGRDYPGRPLLLSLVTVTLGLALYSVRHIPYFSITAALHLGNAFRPAPPEAKFSSSPAVLRQGWGWVCVAAALSLVWIVGIEQSRPGFYGFEPRYEPRGAARYLAQQSRGSQPLKIFAWDDQWASYFIYSLYPKAQVFIDTRFDFYGDAFTNKFEVLRQGALQDMEVLTPWGVDFLVLKKASLARRPSAGPGWTLVYEDQQALIYRPYRQEKRGGPGDMPLAP